MIPSIDLVFITYNRLDYTKISLSSILDDSTEDFSLTIWDNASSDGTAEYLRSELNDPRIKEIVCSKKNIGQIAAVNRIWENSQADLLGKLDNDCIMTPGWTRILAKAHEDIDKLGVVACWHFSAEDFSFERAKNKIKTFGQHQILRHPWTCGTGLLIKNRTFKQFGPIKGKTTTNYWLKLAHSGYINGFYYPLVLQEHMDDPKSKYCKTNDLAGFEAARSTTVGIGAGRYSDPLGRLEWRQEIISNLLDEPYNPAYYTKFSTGLRKIRKKFNDLFRRSGC